MTLLSLVSKVAKLPRVPIFANKRLRLEINLPIYLQLYSAMVFGIIGIAAAGVAIPLSASSTSTSVIGIAQGSNAHQSGGAQRQEEVSDVDKNDPRLAKFTIRTQCNSTAPGRRAVHKKQIVLRDGKVRISLLAAVKEGILIATQLYLDEADPRRRKYKDGHAFSGFYIEYPWEKKPLGLVSTIKPDPPELNWIYVDKTNLHVKYGNKTASLPHIAGPWDWTGDQEGVTLAEEEAFVAMEETPGNWIVCYDAMDDHLQSAGAGTRRVIEISLNRYLL